MKADIKPGIHVADFGCYVGAMTRNLAQLGKPNGRATGIDLHEPQLPDAIFDLIYCRFLLTHAPDCWHACGK